MPLTTHWLIIINIKSIKFRLERIDYHVLCESAPNDASVRIGGEAGVRVVRHRGRASLLLHVCVVPQQLVQT